MNDYGTADIFRIIDLIAANRIEMTTGQLKGRGMLAGSAWLCARLLARVASRTKPDTVMNAANGSMLKIVGMAVKMTMVSTL